MRETYYCLNCVSLRELDTHGACPVCGSQEIVSVDVAKEAVRLGMEIDICE